VATRDYGAVTGALMAVPAKLFEEVGGFDEGLAVGFNDVDLCLRIGERGYQSCYVGTVVAVHHESISRGKSVIDPHPEDSSRFLTRHADLLRFGDEHYGNLMDWWTPLVRFSFAGSKKFKLRATRMGGRDKGLALAPAESVARNAAFS
jgi:GT2 family glycosyltransferase